MKKLQARHETAAGLEYEYRLNRACLTAGPASTYLVLMPSLEASSAVADGLPTPPDSRLLTALTP